MAEPIVDMTDPANRPLAAAIRGLLEAYGDEKYWAKVLSCRSDMVLVIMYDGALPTNRQMSLILQDLKRIHARESNPKIANALAHFWMIIQQIEESTAPNPFLDMGDMKIAQRVTRFTSGGWPDKLLANLRLIPPNQRQDFIDDVMVVFDRYASG